MVALVAKTVVVGAVSITVVVSVADDTSFTGSHDERVFERDYRE